MKKFHTVYTFHLKENIRAKAFLISNLVMALAVLGYLAFTHYTADEQKVNVGYQLADSALALPEDAFAELAEVATFSPADSFEAGMTLLEDSDIDAFFVFHEQDGTPAIEYHFKGLPNNELIMMTENAIYQASLAELVRHHEVDPLLLADILEKPVTSLQPLTKDNENIGIVYVFVFLLYTFIMMFGQTLTNSIMTEKTTRVMEMMLPKVAPLQMMYAKILAILTAGFIQIGVLFLSFYAALQIGWLGDDGFTVFGMSITLEQISLELFALFLLYFTLGFFLYSMLFASLGSMVNRIEDLPSLLAPVIFLVVGSFLVALRSIYDPSSPLVIAASYIPFSSPMVAFSRTVLGEASALEIKLSLLILCSTILFLSIVAGRIYSQGVMKYAASVSFKDVFHSAKKTD